MHDASGRWEKINSLAYSDPDWMGVAHIAPSQDSRVFGPVALENIIGRTWLIYWPPQEIKWEL